MTHTPGPWKWICSDAGPVDEYGCSTPAEIDPTAFKSKGYYANPELIGNNESPVITAGAGEYCPFRNGADALLIAAAPDLLEALQSILNIEGPAMAGGTLGAFKGLDIAYHFDKARVAIAKAKGEPC